MLRGVITGLLLFAGVLPACAQSVVVSPRGDNASVTIYNLGASAAADLSQSRAQIMRGSGLALISETRTVDLPEGPVTIQFRNVSSTMIPQTADVSGLPERVDERNFDFNLLSPASLIQKSVGETVRVARTNPATGTLKEETALLRTGPEGVVLQIGDRVEALKCNALPERLVFERIPSGLYDTPTLSVRTQTSRAGRYTITLRYLTTGIYWTANYVARIAQNDRSLDLKGWITLANFSETSFQDVPVSVVAGRVAISGNNEPVTLPNIERSDNCWPTDINWASPYRLPPATTNAFGGGPGSEMVTVTGTSIRASAPVGANVINVDRNIEARDFADYKLYPLPELTTVAAQQTKQVQFLDQAELPFERIYRGYNDGFRDFQGVGVSMIFLRVQNTRTGKLARPLPSGEVATTVEIGTGSPIPVSFEQQVRDTPIGLPLEVPGGLTHDILIRKRVVSTELFYDNGQRRERTTMEISLVNTMPKPITFEWAQIQYSNLKFISATRVHRTLNGSLTWTFALAPGRNASFQYTVEY